MASHWLFALKPGDPNRILLDSATRKVEKATTLHRRTYGQSARMPKLMVVVLRDNIMFLMVHVVLDFSFRNCESNDAIE